MRHRGQLGRFYVRLLYQDTGTSAVLGDAKSIAVRKLDRDYPGSTVTKRREAYIRSLSSTLTSRSC